MKIRKCITKQNGISLAELLIVLAVLWIVLGAVYGLLEVGFVNYQVGEGQMDDQINVRLAMDRMVEELREAREANNGAFAIAKAETDTITVYADVDSSSSGAERVRYFVPDEGEANEHELRRGVTPASGDPPAYEDSDEEVTTVAKYIENGNEDIFTYFSQDYKGGEDPLPSPVNLVDVTLIRMRLIVDVNPGELPKEIDVKSSVQLRNLKSNLGD